MSTFLNIKKMFNIMNKNINNVHNNGQTMEDAKMAKTQLDSMLPIQVRRALSNFGQEIRDARRRRGIGTVVMAQRASMSRTTLNKIEKGEPGVSLGNYANALFVLDMLERLGDLADIGTDLAGRELEEERAPQRTRKTGQSRDKRSLAAHSIWQDT